MGQVIYLLTDYRGAFWSSTTNKFALCSMDLDRLVSALRSLGWEPVVKSLEEAGNTVGPGWAGSTVAYQTAEDAGLRYKSFVEDVVLSLECAGAKMMPPYRFLRAHHNKVFGHFLCKLASGGESWSPRAECFGTLEEFARRSSAAPVVVKSASGAGSGGVFLARSEREMHKLARRVSRSSELMVRLKEMGRRCLRRGYVRHSLHRNKFIVQEFVPGLTHDFKVLVYGDRYYVLRRDVRAKDFRASGSGRFTWPEDPPVAVLSLAERLRQRLCVPFLSLDVADTPQGPVLFEAQFVGFGPLTLEASRWYFQKEGDSFRRVDEPSVLEEVFALALTETSRT